MQKLTRKYSRLLTMASLLPLVMGTAVFADSAFFGDPPDEAHPWAVHDLNRPTPTVVEPAAVVGGAPSDAVVLFDGTQASFDNWRHVKPEGKRKRDWLVEDGTLLCAPGSGYIATKEEFGDCQLHIEWMAPTPVHGVSQQRGNSGVFLMGQIEVQVLDNYENPTYADGTAGAVYGVMPPAANALRAPGEWQSYDIIFRRPVVRDGQVIDQGSMTVLCNGVVVQDSTPLDGGGGFKARKPLDRVFPDVGSLHLQDHGNPVRYRNIWYRPLRPRAYDGGTDGRIAPEASQAKRTEIAAGIRKDAASKQGVSKALRLYESLAYAQDASARAEADAIVSDFLAHNENAAKGSIEDQKGAFLHLRQAYQYMQKHKILPDNYSALSRINEVVKRQDWPKR
ncbi:MAG: 3-keto-disaccharide hydrolase [Opitutaceae bacterium]